MGFPLRHRRRRRPPLEPFFICRFEVVFAGRNRKKTTMNRSAVPALSTLAVLLAVLLAGVPAAPVFQPNAELNERFERFKSQFEKSYADAAEELRRRDLGEERGRHRPAQRRVQGG